MRGLIVSTIFIITILLFIGTIVLQVILSKKGNKWLGLILPIIAFLFALLVTFNVVDTNNYTEHQIQYNEEGEIIGEITIKHEGSSDTSSTALTIATTFLIYNIPTMIYLFIYFGSREKINMKNQLDKMTIQDL